MVDMEAAGFDFNPKRPIIVICIRMIATIM